MGKKKLRAGRRRCGIGRVGRMKTTLRKPLVTMLQLGHAAVCEAPLRPRVTGPVAWLSPTALARSWSFGDRCVTKLELGHEGAFGEGRTVSGERARPACWRRRPAVANFPLR